MMTMMTITRDAMPQPRNQPHSLMRSIGAFFGHIASAVRRDPGARSTREVRRTVEEERRDDGVILRRTTIEEVEMRRGDEKPPSGAT